MIDDLGEYHQGWDLAIMEWLCDCPMRDPSNTSGRRSAGRVHYLR